MGSRSINNPFLYLGFFPEWKVSAWFLDPSGKTLICESVNAHEVRTYAITELWFIFDQQGLVWQLDLTYVKRQDVKMEDVWWRNLSEPLLSLTVWSVFCVWAVCSFLFLPPSFMEETYLLWSEILELWSIISLPHQHFLCFLALLKRDKLRPCLHNNCFSGGWNLEFIRIIIIIYWM